MLGIWVGLGVGLMASLAIEALTRPKALIMLAGCLAGLGVGSGVEAIRFSWRWLHYKRAARPKHS
jgi:hypothetical protein